MNFFAVIDTNVLVFAMLKWNSVPGTLLRFVFDGTVTAIFNNTIPEEYRNVLERAKFNLPKSVIDTVIKHLENTGIVMDGEKLDIQLPDPGDAVFYEVTMAKRETEETYLVIGNTKLRPPLDGGVHGSRECHIRPNWLLILQVLRGTINSVPCPIPVLITTFLDSAYFRGRQRSCLSESARHRSIVRMTSRVSENGTNALPPRAK